MVVPPEHAEQGTEDVRQLNDDPDRVVEKIPPGLASPIQGFVAGLKTPLYGLDLLRVGLKDYRQLLPYFLLPIAIQTAVVGGLLLLLYFVFGYIEQWVDYLVKMGIEVVGPERFGFDSEATIETINTFSHWGLWLLLILFFIYFFVICWRLTGGLINGYLGGKLCDLMIHRFGWNAGSSGTTLMGELGTSGLLIAGLSLVQPLVGGLVFIPFVGPVLSAVVSVAAAGFLNGYNELRDPLKGMGVSEVKALALSLKYLPLTYGVGFSFIVTEPIPFLGGVVQASESLGRIAVARRILQQEGLVDDPRIVR